MITGRSALIIGVIMAQAVRSEIDKNDPGRNLDLRKLGMWTFLGSEVFFFGALIATHLSMRGKSAVVVEHRELFGNNVLTSILAFILLLSSLTMVLALDAVRGNNQKMFRIWLGATILCGLTFLSGQAYEFNKIVHEGVTIKNSLFGSTFFTMTGFHGTHVFVGVIWLASILISSFRHPNRYNGTNYMAIEMGGLYWHFVDLVWVAIFTLVYLI
jgi:cytochrome c oxidase subunit III